MDGNEISSRMPSQCKIPSYVLDDLSSSQEDMKSPTRILFKIETAYWFYLDFHRVENPSLRECSMKEFSFNLMSHCSQLQQYTLDYDAHFEAWKNYKRTIATYGAIILDQELKHVFEETGFDIMPYIDETEFLEKSSNDQVTRLYIIAGVPLNTVFQPKTRREIRDIQWFPLDTLPTHKGDQTLRETIGQNYNLYMVTPYLRAVRKWIQMQIENHLKSRTRQKSGKAQGVASFQDMAQAKKGKMTNAKINPKGQSVRYSKDFTASVDKSASQAKGRRGMTVFQSLFGNKDGQQTIAGMDFKAPTVDTSSFYSKSWYNFQLDVEGIVSLLPLEGSHSDQASTEETVEVRVFDGTEVYTDK